MIKVITFGVFDLLHYGHINLFKRAKALGDYLIIAVQDDENVVKNKPNTKLVESLAKRMNDVSSSCFVSKSIPYSQVDETIKKVEFDILVVGPDQTNQHFQNAFEWCKRHAKEVVVLPRTEGISSTLIRNGNN